MKAVFIQVFSSPKNINVKCTITLPVLNVFLDVFENINY
jgi:hypothetical protein